MKSFPFFLCGIIASENIIGKYLTNQELIYLEYLLLPLFIRSDYPFGFLRKKIGDVYHNVRIS